MVKLQLSLPRFSPVHLYFYLSLTTKILKQATCMFKCIHLNFRLYQSMEKESHVIPGKHVQCSCTVPEDGESFVLVFLCSCTFHTSTLFNVSIFSIILLFNLLPPFVKQRHKSAWTCNLKTQYLKFQHVIIVQLSIDCLSNIVCLESASDILHGLLM